MTERFVVIESGLEFDKAQVVKGALGRLVFVEDLMGNFTGRHRHPRS